MNTYRVILLSFITLYSGSLLGMQAEKTGEVVSSNENSNQVPTNYTVVLDNQTTHQKDGAQREPIGNKASVSVQPSDPVDKSIVIIQAMSNLKPGDPDEKDIRDRGLRKEQQKQAQLLDACQAEHDAGQKALALEIEAEKARKEEAQHHAEIEKRSKELLDIGNAIHKMAAKNPNLVDDRVLKTVPQLKQEPKKGWFSRCTVS